MRPAPFRHIAPRSKAAACALLAEHGGEARVLAGGQSLVPLMNLRLARPAVLIDLNWCADLSFIERRDGVIAYGAMTRQIEAQEADFSKQECSLLSQALALAGPLAIRSRGTVGGVLAHADRSAELPAVALAREAVFIVQSVEGLREVQAEAFFVDDLTTAIQEDEMLCEIRFPIDEVDALSTFVEIGTRQRDMALAGLAAYINLNRDGTCRKARLAVIGVGPVPQRLREIEQQLPRRRIEQPLIDELARQACNLVDPLDDLHASAAYRRHATGALVAQALEQAARAALPARRG